MQTTITIYHIKLIAHLLNLILDNNNIKHKNQYKYNNIGLEHLVHFLNQTKAIFKKETIMWGFLLKIINNKDIIINNKSENYWNKILKITEENCEVTGLRNTILKKLTNNNNNN